jgi:membrane-bound lytic murein transglycosylase B
MVKKTIVFILFCTLFIYTPKVYADFDCLTLNTSSSSSDKAYCQNQLNQIEAELTDLLNKQADQQKQTGTLKGDVDYLTSQINALKVKIKARALVIAKLKVDIIDKTNTITSLVSKIDREHASLAQLLRNTNEFDNNNVVNLILSEDSVSNFYDDLESYNTLKQSIKNSVDIINGVKTQTEVAKSDLQKQQNAETDAKAELENAQQVVAKSEADKQQLLNISKQKEVAYRQLAAQKKAQADKIRSALFSLAGISTKIDFGTALNYANEVKNKLGVDPAFLLAILTQESNLGANVGQCYLTNPDTGAGVGKNTGTPFSNVMKPTRDVAPFLEITNALSFNAYQTAVSCPIAGVAGYGGAMGPAQFIPSTWKLFEDRLQTILGYFANPWSPRDAFMASGIYLSDLGAVGTSASAQNRAACKYYGSGGSSCSYSRSVQKLKNTIQANIDLL